MCVYKELFKISSTSYPLKFRLFIYLFSPPLYVRNRAKFSRRKWDREWESFHKRQNHPLK